MRVQWRRNGRGRGAGAHLTSVVIIIIIMMSKGANVSALRSGEIALTFKENIFLLQSCIMFMSDKQVLWHAPKECIEKWVGRISKLQDVWHL